MSNDMDLLSAIEEKFPDLSKGQKRIAQFLLEHYDKAVYLTAARLGETAGVSESTVVRFAIELGFDGYPKMQKALEELVKNKLTASQRIQVSSDRILKGNKHILKAVLESDLEKIQSTINNIDQENFDKVVEAILNGKKIYIVGGRSSAALSAFLAFYLNLMIDNVINVNSATVTEIFEQIYRIDEEDVFVGISFPRYSQRTIKAMEYANQRKAKTIAVTDSIISPLLKFADLSLIARSDMVSFVDSLVAPMSVINALLVAISIKKQAELIDTMDRLERLWNEYQVYTSHSYNKYKW